VNPCLCPGHPDLADIPGGCPRRGIWPPDRLAGQPSYQPQPWVHREADHLPVPNPLDVICCPVAGGHAGPWDGL